MDKHLHIISRKKAKELGMSEYFTGKPCKNGGVAAYSVTKRRCSCDLCKMERSLKAREWKRNNPEKVRESKRKWNKSAQGREAARRRWHNNPELHADSIVRAREWREKNSHLLATKRRDYRNRNPLVDAKYKASRDKRILNTECELTELVEVEAAALRDERMSQTGVEWHVDHTIPLRAKEASGLHTWANLQVIPAYMNTSKQNKMIYTEPFEWAKYLEE